MSTAPFWLRLLLPLAVLFCAGCLAVDLVEDPQGDEVANVVQKEPEVGQQKKSLTCYEDDLRFPPIISRDAWDLKKGHIFTSNPVDYIVVHDGGKRCKTNAECLVSLAAEMRKTADVECRTPDNFYVGGNGEVYEGRGWRGAPYWHLNGMRQRVVTVKFLGSYEAEGPSERVMRAFWRMARVGVWESMLSADYRVVSMGQVYNDSTLVGHALEKVFLESSVGTKEVTAMATWETTPDKSLPLITREEWGAKTPTKTPTMFGFNVKYVMINEGGERCFTAEECTSRIRAEQEQQLPLYGDLVDNFYIGDDGHVYEGRGFSVKPLWDLDIDRENSDFFKDESLTVRFFGHFQSDRPSEKAIGALKLLVNAGVSMHKIGNNYNIYSLRGVYNEPQILGDELYHIIKKWTPWASHLDKRFAKELEEGDSFVGMVKRNGWEAKDAQKEFASINHPVDFVFIEEYSASEKCLTSKECIGLMKEIQDKDLEEYGDVWNNFYISDNGNVYEGRGWENEAQFQPTYFNKSLITVTFLGNHSLEASVPALAAFNNLIRFGVKHGKIAPNYHFYSSRHIYDDAGLLGEVLNEHFMKEEHWSKKLDAFPENERLDSGLLPIVPHAEYSGQRHNATHHTFSDPVHYIVISSIGDRCFTRDDCGTIMKESESRNTSNDKGLTDNFYIGEDGMAYEGRGWSFAPSMYFEGFKSEFYFVSFLGQFGKGAKPAKRARLAFNRLMENGVKSHKLSSDYKIVSIHQIFESESSSTKDLYEVIKTWDRWTSEFVILPGDEGASSVDSMFVSRAKWHAKDPVHTVPIETHPLQYLAVHNVGDHCSDLASCSQSMQGIQKNTPERHWDVADNFYIGDDGHIYEGRGWDSSSFWTTRGIENNMLSVGFLGSFESDPPSKKAQLAFHILKLVGVGMGKLSPAVMTMSLGQVIKEGVVVSEKLFAAMKGSQDWSDEVNLQYDKARLRSLNSPFILKEEWKNSDLQIRTSSKMKQPLKYIAIRDGGESCDTYATCVERIRREHSIRHESGDGGLAENFYIGNDGNVYEGVGWDWDMSWGFTGWQQTISVQFFGVYQNDLPSPKAIEALNTVIIKYGIEDGKLSPHYHVVPMPEGDSRTIGTKLKEEVMTWKNAVAAIE